MSSKKYLPGLESYREFRETGPWSEIFGKEFACLLIQRYCCAVYDYVEKADISKGYQNPKRKLGVTAHFSETFGKKMPYILCILKLFLELWLLSYF